MNEETILELAKNIKKTDFVFKCAGKYGEIFIHKSQPNIELAIIREQSKPHYHKLAPAFFVFLSDNASLRIGCVTDFAQKEGFVCEMHPEKHKVYRVDAYALHDAGPLEEGNEVELFIYNDYARDRDDEAYPIDTFYTDCVKYF